MPALRALLNFSSENRAADLTGMKPIQSGNACEKPARRAELFSFPVLLPAIASRSGEAGGSQREMKKSSSLCVL
jgi:hypothetical protein